MNLIPRYRLGLLRHRPQVLNKMVMEMAVYVSRQSSPVIDPRKAAEVLGWENAGEAWIVLKIFEQEALLVETYYNITCPVNNEFMALLSQDDIDEGRWNLGWEKCPACGDSHWPTALGVKLVFRVREPTFLDKLLTLGGRIGLVS